MDEREYHELVQIQTSRLNPKCRDPSRRRVLEKKPWSFVVPRAGGVRAVHLRVSPQIGRLSHMSKEFRSQNFLLHQPVGSSALLLARQSGQEVRG